MMPTEHLPLGWQPAPRREAIASDCCYANDAARWGRRFSIKQGHGCATVWCRHMQCREID